MSLQHGRKPRRVLGVSLAAAALVAAVAAPAFAAVGRDAATTADDATAYQDAGTSAQQIVVASDADGGAVDRGSYAATTAEEIQQKKAEEEAVARAKAAAEAAAAKAAQAASTGTSASTTTSAPVDNSGLVMENPGGAIRLPLPAGSYTLGDVFMDPSRNNHEGQDMLAPAMTEIYAVADGTVVISSESYSGFGNAIVVEHQMGGNSVKSYYAHMTNGTRRVQVGDHVSAGQLIGQVGSTGNSTANHLHFEIEINGTLVDPMDWLRANGVNP